MHILVYHIPAVGIPPTNNFRLSCSVGGVRVCNIGDVDNDVRLSAALALRLIAVEALSSELSLLLLDEGEGNTTGIMGRSCCACGTGMEGI